MIDDHARRSDPTSSHEAVHAIVHSDGLNGQVRVAARRLHPAPFDDWDLLELVEEQTQQRQQRNVIARARGRNEQAGELVRLGVRERADGRKTLHFRLRTEGEIEYTNHSFCPACGERTRRAHDRTIVLIHQSDCPERRINDNDHEGDDDEHDD